MTRRSALAKYFPTAPQQHRTRHDEGSFITHPDDIHTDGKQALDGLSTKWRTILSLEMQGYKKHDIAQIVGMTDASVSVITRDDRYVEYRDAYLATIDKDFLAMKPLAFAALKNGLESSDEDTALKASDQWFKAAAYGGYSKREEAPATTTAEDVVRQLLNINADNVQVNVTTNINRET